MCDICDKCFTRSAVLRRHCKMHCRVTSRDTPDRKAQAPDASDASDLHQPPGSLAQDMAEALLPAPGKLPSPEAGPGFHGHPTAAAAAAAGPFCKFRTLEPLPAGNEQEKLTLDPQRLAKGPLPPTQPPAYVYSDASATPGDELPADGMALIRSSLATLDGHGPDSLGSRGTTAAYRNAEGQFFSSMTLWGLAMKTLQNEGELEQ